MPQTTRTFRIFVSSTFSDLKAERSALQTYVFPRLRELAMAHGCRFQAIDLRWGVSEEAGLDQQTMRICLGEVERCQQVSPKPNFLILLGDRFGWRPLPYAIPAEEFERLLPLTTPEEQELLLWRDEQPDGKKGWYRLDNNAMPAEYLLQPRQKGTRFEEYSVWEREVERPLLPALERAARNAGLDEESLVKYTCSATGQEIMCGAMNVADSQSHVFAFFRSIRNLADAGSEYSDRTSDGLPDEEALRRQGDLKKHLVERLGNHVSEYTAQWENGGLSSGHIGSLPDTLEACLKLHEDGRSPSTLCEAVWQKLSRVILAEVEKLEDVDPLQKEQEAHTRFADQLARFFIGRQQALREISAYLKGDSPHPLVLWGPAGSGKTALMAKASQLNSTAKGITVTRFIGATPQATRGQALLAGLCRQITRHYAGDESSIPTRYRELVEEFPRRLALSSADKPLILFLDALDQLSETDQAQGLAWLPAKLPPHVKIVVSALPKMMGNVLGTKLEVQPLTVEDGSAILERWLDHAGRRLNEAQKHAVLSQFTRSGLPLYLKLAFEEARLWTSYEGLPGLADDTTGMAQALFKRLQLPQNHGEVLISRVLAYLRAAKNGLSEDEILDVLSEDEAVMADFRARSPKSPKSSRLPVVIWARLFADLEPYLLEREADGTTLFGFYHRQISEAAGAILSPGEMSEKHLALGRYFGRQVWWFAGDSRSPNVRKTAELPFQWAQAGDALELIPVLSSPDFFIIFSDTNQENYQDLMEYWEIARRQNQASSARTGLALTVNAASFYRQAWSAVLDQPAYAIQAGRVGSFLIEMGHPQEAEYFLLAEQQALASHADPDGDTLTSPVLTAANLIDQGLVFSRQKNFPAAASKYQEAIPLLESVQSPEAAAAYCNLADVSIEEGKFDQAQRLLDNALSLRKAHCGERSPETATVLQALGNLHLRQQHFEESLARHQEALAIRQECLGDGHVDVGRSLYNIGAALFNLGKYTESNQAARRAREILQRTWNPEDERMQLVDTLIGEYTRLHEAVSTTLTTTGIVVPIWSGGNAGPGCVVKSMGIREALHQKLALLLDETMGRRVGMPILFLAAPGFDSLKDDLAALVRDFALPANLVSSIVIPHSTKPGGKLDLGVIQELSRIPGRVAGWMDSHRLETIIVSPLHILTSFDWKLVEHAKTCGKAMVSEMIPFGPVYGPLVGLMKLAGGQSKVAFMTLDNYKRQGFSPQPRDSVSTGIFYLNLRQIKTVLDESHKANSGLMKNLFKQPSRPDLNKTLREKISAALTEAESKPQNGQEIADWFFCALVDLFGTALVENLPDKRLNRIQLV